MLVEFDEGEHTNGPGVHLGEDGKQELMQGGMRPAPWVVDCLLQEDQSLHLTVLLHVVEIDLTLDINGGNLGDQVVGGPGDELLKGIQLRGGP